MAKKTFFKMLYLLGAAFFLHSNVSGQSVFDTIVQRIYTDIQLKSNFEQRTAQVRQSLSSILSNGSWKNIDYTNPDSKHLDLVLSMAISYVDTGYAYYKDPLIYKAILESLRFWFSTRRHNTNWYFNDIAFPQRLGQIMIIMRKADPDLPTGLRDTLLNGLNFGAARHPNTQSGANETDVALHYLYRAALTRDTAVMDTAYLKAYASVMQVDDEDGLNFDNSFLAHTRQLSIHSYGGVFVGDVLEIAGYLRGTAFAIPKDKLQLLIHFYKDTFIKTGRNNYVDFNTMGRGISRGSGAVHKKTFRSSQTPLLSKVSALAPANLKIWDAVAGGSYQIKPLHTHYFCSDYDLHIRPAYTFSVHAVSSRTRRTEQGNGENLLGKFLPDGATDIQRWGGEYQNIFPLWEWDKIPGVTSRDFPDDMGSKIEVNWGEKGTSNFAGGVSDSLYGASAYAMQYNGVSARKSWFFFDKEVVCLGAGITSDQPEKVITTVNQCWLYGVVKAWDNNTSQILNVSGAASFANPQWIVHDSIGYFFPQREQIHVTDTLQTGSWNRINKGRSSASVVGKVFKLWIDHGAQPKGAKYAYIVVPGLGNIKAMQDYPVKNIRIMSNDSSIQAVMNTGLDMIQAVFYNAGTLIGPSITLTVNQPCVVMLKNLHGPKVFFSVADPTERLYSVKINLKLPGTRSTKQWVCKLPASPYRGQSAIFSIISQTPGIKNSH